VFVGEHAAVFLTGTQERSHPASRGDWPTSRKAATGPRSVGHRAFYSIF
jgi:hypothetical protein